MTVTLFAPSGVLISGLNTTLTVQVPYGANAAQLFVCSKSYMFVPVIVTTGDKGVLPGFVKVTIFGALIVSLVCEANASEVVDSLTAFTPAPVKAIVCLPAVSLTFRIAVRTPVVSGLKTTLMMQLAPTAKLVPQLLVCE